MLADMASGTEAARQLTYAAAAPVDAKASDLAYWTSCAKLIAGDTAMGVTTDAVQVLGGYGYITEYPVERMMRDAKITQLYEGTQQIQRLIIARQILQRAGVGASGTEAGAASPVKIVVTVKQVPGHHRREAVHLRPAARPRRRPSRSSTRSTSTPSSRRSGCRNPARWTRSPTCRWVRSRRARPCVARWRWAARRPTW